MDNEKFNTAEDLVPLTVENSFTEYPNIVTVPQLMRMLSIGRNTAYKLLGNGEISYVRIGRFYKIPKVSVINYINKTMTAV